MALNPSGYKPYYVICTHCHYDHIGGITQFADGNQEIIASAAGRDFIESDLETHGLFKFIKAKVPAYKVTWYGQAFERLKWPMCKSIFPRQDILWQACISFVLYSWIET